MEEKKKDPIYELDGTVPLKKALPLGIQHILAMFLGNVSLLIIVCGTLEMGGVLKMTPIQNAMFVAGIATLSRLYPFWRIGSGLPIVMSTSSSFIGTAKAIGAAFGYGALMGTSFTGGISEMVTGYFIKPLCKLFPLAVISLVIISIGPSLLSAETNYFGRGNGVTDFRSTDHLFVGAFIIIVILVAKQFKGAINNASILIGVVAGYILAIVLGVVDFTQVLSASWFVLPAFMPAAFEFNSQATIAMGIMFIAVTVETTGDVSGVANGGLNREATDKELQGGIMADGFGSILGAIFGVLPNTSFSQSVGLTVITKVVNYFVTMTGAVFLILCRFCPKLSALFSIMPQSMLGGAAVIMLVMILVSSIQSLTREPPDERNGLIVALAISLGVGIGNVPAVPAQFPSWVGNIFVQNGIIMTFVIAMVLNLTLPKKKSEEEQYEDFPDWIGTDWKIDPHSGTYSEAS